MTTLTPAVKAGIISEEAAFCGLSRGDLERMNAAGFGYRANDHARRCRMIPPLVFITADGRTFVLLAGVAIQLPTEVGR